MVQQWSTICKTDRDIKEINLDFIFCSRNVRSRILDNFDGILRHRQHQRSSVVPVDIHLHPIPMVVNAENGSERSNRNRVWVSRHRYQADAIAFLKSCLHGWSLDSFRRYGESSAFGLHELAVVPFGQVAKDRAVQGRVRSLATRACPIALGFHRCDQLLGVHRFARFAKNLQGRSDTAQSLLARVGVGSLSGRNLRLARLLETRNRCGRFVSTRFDGCRLDFNNGQVAFGGYFRATSPRANFPLQSLTICARFWLKPLGVGCPSMLAAASFIDAYSKHRRCQESDRWCGT